MAAGDSLGEAANCWGHNKVYKLLEIFKGEGEDAFCC